MSGKLLILTGLTGSGKDAIIERLLAKPDFNFKRIVTHNTRPPRPNEKHGHDYYFIGVEEFKTLIKSGEMIEHVEHGSYLKGTSRSEFQRILDGENLIWRIELSRAAMAEEFFLKKFGPKVGERINKKIIKILISVSDTKVLFERYKSREDSFKISEFKKRLKQDTAVLNMHRHHFPNIINNDSTIESAVDQVVALLS